MKKLREKSLVIGLLVSSFSQIVSHFIKMPDFVAGLLMGVGIGIMLLGFIRQKRNPRYL